MYRIRIHTHTQTHSFSFKWQQIIYAVNMNAETDLSAKSELNEYIIISEPLECIELCSILNSQLDQPFPLDGNFLLLHAVDPSFGDIQK